MSTIWAACNSLIMGFALLYMCLFSLTIPHRSLIYVRLIIAPQTVLFFWDFGYGSYKPPTLMISSTMATIGLYGIMRVLEHSIISLWDSTPPHWVRAEKNGSRIRCPPPECFRGRCFYAFDLLTSQRGASWSSSREWNWTPRRFQSWIPPPPRQFLMDGIKGMLIQYLLLDLCDTITKSRRWDTTLQYPVTSLPVLEQPVFTMCICVGAFLSINFAYTAVSTVCVLCGSSPDSWPPMFDSPFSCTSLSDFWAHRWHWMFRRVFDRLSLPLVCVTTSIVRLNDKGTCQKEHVASAIRTISIFGLSTLLHLFIMHRVAIPEYHKNYGTANPPFWDPDILMFFMGQPLGLLLESTVIIRVATWIFPSEEHPGDRQQASQTRTSVHPSSRFGASQNGTRSTSKPNTVPTGHRWERVALMRLYTWIFLLSTGRWGADKWVRVGFFHENEMVVPFSVWRGLWHGKWIA